MRRLTAFLSFEEDDMKISGAVHRAIQTNYSYIRCDSTNYKYELEKAGLEINSSNLKNIFPEYHFALIFLSPSFNDSNFLVQTELPTFLELENENGMLIIPIIVEPCKILESLENKEIADFSKSFEDGLKQLFSIIDNHKGNFVGDIIDVEILRVSIPQDRLWSKEISGLLDMFGEYLRKIKGSSIKLVQTQSENILICGFYSSDESVTRDEIPEFFNSFTSFLNLCLNDPFNVEELIKYSELPPELLEPIVSRYSRNARRLLFDIKQSYEHKALQIRHSLEVELLETSMAAENEKTITLARIDEIKNLDFQNPYEIIFSPPVVSKIQSNQQINVTNIINSQIIDRAEGMIVNEIKGTVNYTEQDNNLLELFEKFASHKIEFLELQSALDESKDKSLDKAQRKTATERMTGFLTKHKEAIGKTAFELFKEYLKSQLK